MSRSYRKAKRHLGNFMRSPITTGDRKFFRLRHPKQYRQVTREASDAENPKVRKKSIPPSANDDIFAYGRVGK